jgi:hypothetical protein
MYVPGDYDKTFVIPVWGRAPWNEDKVFNAHVSRRTYHEALAFVVGLGYVVIDVGR